jgi:hypothetical protein
MQLDRSGGLGIAVIDAERKAMMKMMMMIMVYVDCALRQLILSICLPAPESQKSESYRTCDPSDLDVS